MAVLKKGTKRNPDANSIQEADEERKEAFGSGEKGTNRKEEFNAM